MSAMPARCHRPSLALSVAALLMLSLAACAPKSGTVSDAAPASTSETATTTPPAEPAVDPAAPVDAAALCNAAAAQSFVGKAASEDNVAQAQQAAGANGDVRVIKPGQAVTMDYRGDRINIEVDDLNMIVKITCG